MNVQNLTAAVGYGACAARYGSALLSVVGTAAVTGLTAAGALPPQTVTALAPYTTRQIVAAGGCTVAVWLLRGGAVAGCSSSQRTWCDDNISP
jgi:hypothetical protein